MPASTTRLFRVLTGAAATLVLAAPVLCAPSPAAAEVAPIVARYSSILASVNAHLTPASRTEMARRVLLLSSYYQIDPRLLLAVVTVESSWRASALSPAGALGFGQLMPATAATLDVQALEPYENLDGTARYLRRLMMRYASADPATRVKLAVASYNAGPYAVQRYRGVPPYAQTQSYVRRVLAQWHHFSALLDSPSPSLVTALVAHPPAAPVAAVRRARPEPPRELVAKAVRPQRLEAPARTLLGRVAATQVRVATLAAQPQPAVRYEPSHSFFARLFGLRHRVVAPAPASVAITVPNVY
jgi:hypothetical protein